MKCPVCGVWTLIKETRTRENNTKYRRYECGNIHRFTTVEVIDKIIQQKGTDDEKLPSDTV